MLLCDGGSSYSKVYDINRDSLIIVPTKELVKDKTRFYDYATGHSSKSVCSNYVNELIALVEGGLEVIPDDDFTLLDIGARDSKFVIIRNREVKTMDWNSSCGGNIGFTTELLGKYYNIDYNSIKPSDKIIPVTCGLLGIEKIFDEINKGLMPEEVISMFLKGMAKNSYFFAKKPFHLYLSGGFSYNICFVETLKSYCDVSVLGRDILIRGLIRLVREEYGIKQLSSIVKK